MTNTTTTARTPEPRALRPYQTAAAGAVEADWAAGKRRVACVLPTGSGKSTVIGKLATDAHARGERVVMLAHRGELLDQMIRDTKAVAPHLADDVFGIVRADEDDHSAPIVAATLQTLATDARRDALGQRDLILWDEVHHAAADGFHATFDALGGYTTARLCGFTATLYRNDKGKVGLGDIIEKVSYEKDLAWGIRHGFLVKPRGLTVHVPHLDKLGDVRTVAGDFHQAQLAEVMEAATGYVVDAIADHAADRRAIVFAASVDAAHAIADALREAGHAAAAVTGEMAYENRKPIYADFKTGAVQYLVTVMVLTEGADFPQCDAVVLARPTQSKNLYSQMIGRALRPLAGKADALVLDLSGCARRMKLVNLTELLPGVEVTDVDTDGNVIEADEEPAEAAPVKIVRQGPVVLTSIDLLGTRSSLWLETHAGVPFLPGADNVEMFLWPVDGDLSRDAADTGWAVGVINHRTRAGGWIIGGEIVGRDKGQANYQTLEDAVDEAEAFAYRHAARFPYATRAASWRKSAAPSEKQIGLARGLGITAPETLTKAALSDEISVVYATRILDGAVSARKVAEVQA